MLLARVEVAVPVMGGGARWCRLKEALRWMRRNVDGGDENTDEVLPWRCLTVAFYRKKIKKEMERKEAGNGGKRDKLVYSPCTKT